VKLFKKAKDGGPESMVTGWWLVEAKRLLSVALLKFADGSRDAYHSHAFASLNWVIKGRVMEHMLDGRVIEHGPSLLPVLTRRDTFHKVVSEGTTWVFTIRGPWAATWQEWVRGQWPVTLTHGRKEV